MSPRIAARGKERFAFAIGVVVPDRTIVTSYVTSHGLFEGASHAASILESEGMLRRFVTGSGTTLLHTLTCCCALDVVQKRTRDMRCDRTV